MQALSVSIQMETWPIDRLVPYARNPRKNDQAVDRMCASIREFGFKIPCLVRSDGSLVDGHLRLKAVGDRVVPGRWTREAVAPTRRRCVTGALKRAPCLGKQGK